LCFSDYLAPTINCLAKPNLAKSPLGQENTWQPLGTITFGSMPVGIYRVDLILDDKTAWKRFLQNHRLNAECFRVLETTYIFFTDEISPSVRVPKF